MHVFSAKFSNDFPGLRGVNLFAHQYPIEPFLVFTEFYMDRPVFGPHAHAGISVMTYMLPDSKGHFINRDSNGDFSIIEPGGLHITQAGSGIHHDEFPKEKHLMAHGFQIWINHEEKTRLIEPKSFHANPAEIPEIITEAYTIRILHGVYHEIQTKWQMVTDACLLHVSLQSNQTLQISNREMAFVYILKGNGSIDGKAVSPQQLITFSKEESEIKLNAGNKELEFMFATAIPLKQQIVYGGPFVATTPAQLELMKQSYAMGKMGHLHPYENT